VGRAYRHYSAGERAMVLAALAANGGNVKRTARQAGVPRKTLEGWAKGRRLAGVRGEVRHQGRADLADRFEDLAHRLLDAISARLAEASFRELVVALGIVVDKMVLLRGGGRRAGP
jgi:transposase-like protein